nr:FimV/HubP family polar landmark protein [uncultured Kingella sp.]
MIAASLSLITSFSAVAGIGGVNVQSNLGEPFSGSIVVTGQEAQAVLQNGASVSGSGISGSVAPHGNGNAIIRLRSNSVVNDPILTFTVRAGNQTRQYTAMINPSHYRPYSSQARSNRGTHKAVELKPQQQHRTIERDDVEMQQEMRETREVAPRAERTHAASPRYHRVHSGETLASIAARYRPHGMSVQRAMRALMAANPRAFRKGKMYHNVTLYIPTASQFHAYAKSAQRKNQAPRISRGAALVAPIVKDDAVSDAVETKPSKVVTPPPVKVEPVKPVAKNQMAEGKPVAEKPAPEKTDDVEPEKTPASKPAPEETQPVKPEASQAEDMQPEKTVAASESTTAPVETASAETAPVAEEKPEPAVEPKPAAPEAEPVAEEGLDWTLIGGGVGALALAGLGGYLLNRRRKTRAASFDGDKAETSGDEFDGRDIQFDGTASPDVDDWMLDANVAKADESDEDFFDLPADAVDAPAASSQTFDLDSFEPEQFDDASDEWAVSLEEEAPAEANPLVAANATSFDADDWQVDDIVSIEPEVSEPAAFSSQATIAADDFIIDETPIGQPEIAASADDDFLSFDDSISDDIIPAPAEEAAFDLDAFNDALPDIVDTPAETTTASSDDFLDFDASDVIVPAAATAAVAAATSDVSLDDFSLDTPVQSSDSALDVPAVEEVAPVLEAPEVPEFVADLEAPAIEEHALDFVAPEVALDDFSVEAPAADALDSSLDTPAVEVPAVETPAVDAAMDFALDDFSVETPAATPVAEAAFDDGLDFAVADEPVIEAEPATVDFGLDDTFDAPAADFAAVEEPAATLDDLSFDQPAVSTPAFDDLSFDEPAAPATEQAVDDLSSWDMGELPETPNNDAGFVSEAVGLTEPLEAKLELAKMYLEIDDAVAARETLRELVAESNGDIQVQAQQLLDELGG